MLSPALDLDQSQSTKRTGDYHNADIDAIRACFPVCAVTQEPHALLSIVTLKGSSGNYRSTRVLQEAP
jgi:hypothetical protein